MKSDQVRLGWRDVLQDVRNGGTIVIEHYKQAIARLVPEDDTIVVLRARTPNEAERLRRLIREHGALGIPFPNNATPGLRVVDQNGEAANPHSIPSVAVTIVSSEEPSMTTSTVSREALGAWLGDHHGLSEEGIATLLDKAAEIGRDWPDEQDRERRMDRLWWAYQDIVTAAASSQQEALDIIHGKGRTGVDPWAYTEQIGPA